MASTYENDLRLEEMATGENSGSWGTKTNTNLELIADAFSYGTETIANADTTITIADGAADAARSLALKINSSADLTTTRTITLAPNTTSKVWIIENNTSGGQTLTISAGSGSNITLLNGQTKIIATDGIGAGSNVVELTQDLAIADLFIDDDLSMQSDGAIINFGADADITLTHAADTSLTLGGAGTTTGLVVNNTATDGDPILGFALSGTNTFTMGVDDGDSDKFKIGTSAIGTDTRLTITSAGAVGVGESSPDVFFHIKTADDGGVMTIESTNASSSSGPNLNLLRTSASPADGDNIGKINFQAYDDGSNNTVYANIQTLIRDTTNTTEDGRMLLNTIVNGALVSRVELDNDETVINENSYDLDFRVESDGNSNMLFVDAGENAVKIGGTSTREGQLQIFTNASGVAMEIESTNGTASQGPILQLRRTSASPAGNDYLGALNFVGQDSGDNALSYVDMYTRATTITDGSEESQFSIRTRRNGNLEERFTLNAVETTFNEVGADIDFRVESDSNTHALFVDASADKVAIGSTQTNGKLTVIGSGSGTYNNLTLSSDAAGNTVKTGGLTYLNYAGNSASVYQSYTSSTASALYFGSADTSHRGPTAVYFMAADGLDTTTSHRKVFNYTKSNFVINDDSADVDFRVESDNQANMLLVDAGNDSVAINRSYGIAPLHVSGSANDTVAPENSYAKITDQGLDGLAFGSISSSPFTGWIQSGYTDNTYSPDWNNGYPLALNPVNANVVIGGTNVTDSTDGLAIQSSSRDNLSIQYTGTSGGHVSGIRFFDFRGQLNARVNNNLINDGVGVAEAHLEFGTAYNGTFYERLSLSKNEAVFNDQSADTDFRVESDSSTHMLFVDAANNRVGIGKSSPDYTLDIDGQTKVYYDNDQTTLLATGYEGAFLHTGLNVATGSTSYTPHFEGTVRLLGTGYVSHTTLATKRNGTSSWSDGAILAYGGNDAGPTQEWEFTVNGVFNSPSTKNFKIKHPLPALTDTHTLFHAAIEGPNADLIYRGVVDLVAGSATVNIDTESRMTEGTFVALTKDVQSFTSNETDWTAVRGSVSGNILTVEAQDSASTASVSWMVVAKRNDSNVISNETTDDNGEFITERLDPS